MPGQFRAYNSQKVSTGEKLAAHQSSYGTSLLQHRLGIEMRIASSALSSSCLFSSFWMDSLCPAASTAWTSASRKLSEGVLIVDKHHAPYCLSHMVL